MKEQPVCPCICANKGVEVNSRTFREYHTAADLPFLRLASVLAIKTKRFWKKKVLLPLYRGSTHIGKSGLEKNTITSFGIPKLSVEKASLRRYRPHIEKCPVKMGQT